MAGFIIFFTLTGIILSLREPIRGAARPFGSYQEIPKYSLDFPGNSLPLDEALDIAYKAFGKKENISRIELKWERQAPIYRVRFKHKEEPEITVHAVTGEVLLSVSKKEIKAVAEELHAFNFLPAKLSWVLDASGIMIILLIISGFMRLLIVKKISQNRLRRTHAVSSLAIGIPFLLITLSGILLNHKDWLEKLDKKYVSAHPAENTPLDFRYNSLPVTAQKAVEIFQNQFPKPKVLRRAMLTRRYGTLIWQVESEEGMRNPAIIDACRGEIIKSARELAILDFSKRLHEFYFFGDTSKYVITLISLVALMSAATGFSLCVKRK